MHRLTSVAAAALGAWLLVAGSAYAQQGTGELRGKVMDAQNAVLPGVTVTCRTRPATSTSYCTTLIIVQAVT